MNSNIYYIWKSKQTITKDIVVAVKIYKNMKNITLILVIIQLICFQPILNAQSSGFKVTPCQDSMAVIDLFDSVFFSILPSQNITNLEFRGDPTAVGYFESGYFLGFNGGKGIVLTTGKAADADNSNICGTAANASTNNNGVQSDPDLQQINNGISSNDGCIIEFDFLPKTNKIQFNYVFASEEYNDYVFASFNDGFGLFLSGEGIDGDFTNNADNVALLPGSNISVSIDNVNKGKGGKTCTGAPTGCTNCEYFINNSETADPAFNKFVYDAYTKVFQVEQYIFHGEWYHVKIAIGDSGDGVFDSAIFLEEKSFKTGSITKLSGPRIMK
jgi:hypothetical protein